MKFQICTNLEKLTLIWSKPSSFLFIINLFRINYGTDRFLTIIPGGCYYYVFDNSHSTGKFFDNFTFFHLLRTCCFNHYIFLPGVQFTNSPFSFHEIFLYYSFEYSTKTDALHDILWQESGNIPRFFKPWILACAREKQGYEHW